MRWILVLVLVSSLLVVGLLGSSRAAAKEAPWNVLFITVDTLRADHLHCCGYGRDTSPNIDRLSSEGVLFTHGIVQWPKTTPSFASMLTGTYACFNGVKRQVRQPISGHFDVLAEVMRDGGYATVGYVTNPNLGRIFHFDQGFDTFVNGCRDPVRKRAEDVTRFGIEWLEEWSGEKPFFMWLHYIDPHAPYNPPRHRGRYFKDEFYSGARTASLNQVDWDAFGGIPKNIQCSDSEGRVWDEVDYYVALYDAEIRYMDDCVGELLAAVKAMGLEENTLVVFTADHGESLGDHEYYFEHGALPYDACSRVPLIIKVPGLDPESRTVTRPMELIHVMPTILDVVGLAPPAVVQGTSLMPFMRYGDDRNLSDYAFTEAGYSENYQRVIRRGSWKLIHAPAQEDQELMKGVPFELYDLASDPNELENVIDANPEIAEELKGRLFEWMETAASGASNEGPGEVEIDQETEEALRAIGYTK